MVSPAPAATPVPSTARMPAAMADAIVAQARAEYPNEACGIVIGSGVAAEGGEALRYAAAGTRPRRRTATSSTAGSCSG